VRSLLKEYEWVFFLDLDAIIVDMSRRLEHILEAAGNPSDFFFSGDTNLINSGVLLYHQSNWMDKFLAEALTMGLDPEWDGLKKIGMGTENAAFAILLAGCSSRDSHSNLKACYDRVDGGYTSINLSRRIIEGDQSVLDTFAVPSHIQRHIIMLPQSKWQSHHLLHSFVLHYPGDTSEHELAFKNHWFRNDSTNETGFDRKDMILASIQALYGEHPERKLRVEKDNG